MHTLQPPDFTNSRPWGVYAAALLLAVAAGCALLVDVQVARFALADKRNIPGDLRRIFDLAEVFAHGAGAICICMVVATLDGCQRWRLPRLFACSLGVGLLVNLVKVNIGRTRPMVDGKIAVPDSVTATFTGLLPWVTDSATAMDRNLQSFPSGHATLAAGLAVGLAALYPRGRWLFAFFACLAALQRVASGAHYLSDIFAGGAAGCLFAAICLDPVLLGRLFNRIEKHEPRAGAVEDEKTQLTSRAA